MAKRTLRSIVDELPPGTRITSRSIVDDKPDVYVWDPNVEDREEWGQRILQDKTLSPKRRLEIVYCGPEETYEERLARDRD